MALSLGRPAAFALTLALLASSLSCGVTSPSLMTDSVPGVLTPGNFQIHTFSTTAGGNVTITLVSLAVPLTLEVQLGSVDVTTGTCAPQVGNTQFTVGTVWVNSVSSAGTYCVILDDTMTANPPASVAYLLTVQHPT